MRFVETKLQGAFILELERREDDRGFFARSFCQREFAEYGLNPVIAQANVLFSKHKGTLRGMHFQFPPAADTKLVSVTRGAIIDIIVDLRPESPTYLQHVAVELTASNHRSVYVPERFAHGCQALEDSTEFGYLAGAYFDPQSVGGLAHDDPRLGLVWPLPVTHLSTQDAAWKPVAEIEFELKRKMSLAELAQRSRP
ncbi:MAG TPA: dTDP-4-dehydrorhamnose 3,5-epimerase family protein [Ktedonobacterales bacterium]|nr:dTDP-4-dehydrorhamnose 3,5-epimerase family protein [Ktedonobacterales bacterium]